MSITEKGSIVKVHFLSRFERLDSYLRKTYVNKCKVLVRDQLGFVIILPVNHHSKRDLFLNKCKVLVKKQVRCFMVVRHLISVPKSDANP